VLSTLLFSGLFADGFRHDSPLIQFDTSGAIWVNAWVAHAVAHLQNPFFSHNLMHPYGVNLLANAYNVGMSLVFVPVTWALGPVASTNLQLMLDPVLGSLAMGLVLTRFVKVQWLCVVGGLLWGFSPFVVSALEQGWTNVGLLVAPPLVMWLVAELYRDGGWTPRRIGLSIAAIVVVQYFIDSEVLVITAIGALTAVIVLTFQRRGTWRRDLARVGSCLAWSAVPAATLLAAPIAYGAYGPHPLPAWVHPRAFFAVRRSPLIGVILDGESPMHRGVVNASFLGLALVLITLTGYVALRIRGSATTLLATGLVGLWLSVGAGPWWSPWPLIADVPSLHNITTTRFILITWLAVIVLLAMTVEALIEMLVARRHLGARVSTAVAAVVVAVATLTPVIAIVAYPPRIMGSTSDPALADILKSPGDHVVMGFPFPASTREMLQQAETDNFQFSMPGGQWPQIMDPPEPWRTWMPTFYVAVKDRLDGAPTYAQLENLDAWIGRWGVTDIVVPRAVSRARSYLYHSPREFVAIITEALGAPRVVDGEWVWMHIHPRVPLAALGTTAFSLCANSRFDIPTRNVPACVLAAASSPLVDDDV
jgi:hypothetical protein